MDEITLKLPVDVYARLREMVLAGGKYPATGENGIHSASQLLLFMDQQIQQQQKSALEKVEEIKEPPGKPNGGSSQGSLDQSKCTN